MFYRNRADGRYPVTRDALTAARPNISFPASWDAGVLDMLAVDEVFPVPPPDTEAGFAAVEGDPEPTTEGTWRQTWRVIAVEIPPPEKEPVPQNVSRFQARAAMMLSPATDPAFPHLLAQIEAAVAASGNPMTQLAWAEAVAWTRSSPTVNALGAAVGVTAGQLDALFRSAARIVA